MLKVNNDNKHRSSVFIVNLEHILHLFLVFLLLTSSIYIYFLWGGGGGGGGWGWEGIERLLEKSFKRNSNLNLNFKL